MKLKFTGKDFMNLPLAIPGEMDSLDCMAERANARLAEMLKDAPSHLMKEIKWFDGHTQYVPCDVYQNPTHIASLVNIEEIEE